MAVPQIPADLLVDAHAALGEGAFWDAEEQRLFWIDITGRRIFRTDVASAETTGIDVPEDVGAVALRRNNPGFLVAVADGFGILVDGKLDVFAPVCRDARLRMNDGKCDAAGRFWGGSMAYDFARGAGTFYRLDADRRVTAVVESVTISNGLGWSPDGRVLYYIDSPTHRVDAFDFDLAEGRLANRRPVVQTPRDASVPDGMTTDVEGGLWVAFFGGSCVRRYLPDGSLDREVPLPASQVTSCAFGGPRLDTLFITTAAGGLTPELAAGQPHAGGVFACRPGVTGTAAYRYAG